MRWSSLLKVSILRAITYLSKVSLFHSTTHPFLGFYSPTITVFPSLYLYPIDHVRALENKGPFVHERYLYGSNNIRTPIASPLDIQRDQLDLFSYQIIRRPSSPAKNRNNVSGNNLLLNTIAPPNPNPNPKATPNPPPSEEDTFSLSSLSFTLDEDDDDLK